MSDTPIKNDKKSSQDNVVTVSKSELAEIVAAAVAAATQNASTQYADGMSKLADALLESRKPWKDPRQEENDKMMKEQARELYKRIEAQIKLSRQTCPHLQGSNPLSDVAGQLSSFILHYLDNGLVVGICTNCQLTIYSDSKDKEVQRLFQMKSGNKMSQSGRRVFQDPMKAMKVGRLEPQP
jgi:hypothetical protein